MDWLPTTKDLIAVIPLGLLLVILGLDNVIFISILAGKLPTNEQDRARKLGLTLAIVPNILLLFSIPLIKRLNTTLFSALNVDISGQDLIVLIGGLFLVAKATREIHAKLEGEDGEVSSKVEAKFGAVITQIVLLNIVFSLDSVITSIGMAQSLTVMIIAALFANIVMVIFSGFISGFVEKHPTVKMLALSFLILIGSNLVVEAVHVHIPKGYTYFTMAFSVIVECLNIQMRSKHSKPVKLHQVIK